MSLPTSKKQPTELHPNRGVKPTKTNHLLGVARAEIERTQGLKPVGTRGKRLAAGDKATSKNVRKVGVCEAQGVRIPCGGDLQDAHIQRRGHLATRHEPINQTCLCRDHHRFFTNRPRLWQAFIRLTKPGVWKTTYILAHHTPEIPILNTSAVNRA